MNASQKRKALLLECQKAGTLITRRAVEMLGGFYYYNGGKYVGEILGRMVKAGFLVRTKPGHFRLPEKPRPSNAGHHAPDPNQSTLF